ncbi:MAG: hypothetical protein RBU21_16910 [FCB group bacterium]|jgi:hypothetical protein|nr:hypothetical protein [FCB group bacterium]
MTKAYEIRDRDIGGVLDEAIFLFRDNIKFIAIVAGLCIFPFVLGVDLLSFYLGLDQVTIDPDSGMPPDEQMEVIMSLWLQAAGFGSVLNLLSLIGISIADVAIIYGLGHRYLGREVTLGASLRMGVRLLLKMILLGLLIGVMTTIGACMCLIPAFIVMALFFLTPAVLVLENSSMSDALSRSPRLVTGFVWHTIALIFVIGIIGFGIGAFAALIPSVIALHVLYAVTQTAYIAFRSVVVVALYFSARCRVENLDLELMADAVDVPPADEAVL